MPDNYFARYIPLMIQFGVALVLAVGMVLASTLLGKHRYTRAKFTPYECGMTPVGDSRERFSVKFYLVGMLFILFDVEAVFLYPWAIIFKDLGVFGFVEMMVYIAIILAGLWYVWKKGVLDWAERPARTKRAQLDLQHPTLIPAAAPPDPIVEGTKV
jgi:NADH-quinone oxidoreductase subunit A